MDEELNFFDEVGSLLRENGRLIRITLVSGQTYEVNPSDDVLILNSIVFIYRVSGSRSIFPLFQICSVDHGERF
jgi:hypothetical protein